MALHIQMTEEAEAELKKAAARNKISSAAAGTLFLVLGGLILFFTVILIAGPSDPEFMTYTPPAEDLPPTPQPTTQDLSSKPSSPSHDVAPSVIVAVGAAPVQMAQVDVPVDDAADGSGLELGVGMGTGGLGNGLGSGGNGLGDGKGGGSALEGTFYDLKQTRQGSPTSIQLSGDHVEAPGRIETMRILNEFSKGWNAGVLSKYYQSPTKLYASNFMLPGTVSAGYAPICYQCQDKVKPSAWVAVYRGKVKAPSSGTFRFVGTGDDVLMVRFNNQTVLEAGWSIPSAFDGSDKATTLGSISAGGGGKEYHQAVKDGKDATHRGYEFITMNGINKWNNELEGLTAGSEFTVQEGKTYPIEILISEVPGGFFGFALLIQKKEGKQYDNNKFDLFRTNFSCPTAGDLQQLLQGNLRGSLEMPPFNTDSPIWVATP